MYLGEMCHEISKVVCVDVSPPTICRLLEKFGRNSPSLHCRDVMFFGELICPSVFFSAKKCSSG